MPSPLNIVFLGTPGIACAFLEGVASSGHRVSGVISQPDKARGRGMALCCTPVKEKACALGIPVLQPSGSAELAEALRGLRPDLCVVVAYGRLIRKEALEQARLGFVNVHFSLLPKYRGAAPVQRALMNGEKETGVTVFWLDEGMDTGPVAGARAAAVGPDETAPELFARLTSAGRELLAECLSDIAAGKIVREPQRGEPTLAPKIRPEEALLSPAALPAARVHDLARGLACGPRARFQASAGGRAFSVQLLRTSMAAEASPSPCPPGGVSSIERGRGFFLKCADRGLLVEEVQPEGKKPQKAADFLNGLRLRPGDPLAMPGGTETK